MNYNVDYDDFDSPQYGECPECGKEQASFRPNSGNEILECVNDKCDWFGKKFIRISDEYGSGGAEFCEIKFVIALGESISETAFKQWRGKMLGDICKTAGIPNQVGLER